MNPLIYEYLIQRYCVSKTYIDPPKHKFNVFSNDDLLRKGLLMTQEAPSIELTIIRLLEETLEQNQLSQEQAILFTEQLNKHIDTFQEKMITRYNPVIDCKQGCVNCCNHWVEDLYFFEAIAIKEYLEVNSPHLIPAIVKKAKDSLTVFESIEKEFPDYEEIQLLDAFYKKEIPCPLLDDNSNCIIYPLRPRACRGFYSHSRADFCTTFASTRDESQGTFMILPPEEIQEMLYTIHENSNSSYPTALRSLLSLLA